MPTTQNAKKALKVSQKKHSRNRRFLELYKESTNALQKLMIAEKKDKKAISAALSQVYSRVDTLEKKNIIHRNAAARRKSFFARLVASLPQ